MTRLATGRPVARVFASARPEQFRGSSYRDVVLAALRPGDIVVAVYGEPIRPRMVTAAFGPLADPTGMAIARGVRLETRHGVEYNLYEGADGIVISVRRQRGHSTSAAAARAAATEAGWTNKGGHYYRGHLSTGPRSRSQATRVREAALIEFAEARGREAEILCGFQGGVDAAAWMIGRGWIVRIGERWYVTALPAASRSPRS